MRNLTKFAIQQFWKMGYYYMLISCLGMDGMESLENRIQYEAGIVEEWAPPDKGEY